MGHVELMNQLTAVLKRAEEFFADQKCPVDFWCAMSDQAGYIGFFKSKRKREIYIADHQPEEQLTDDSWRPVAETRMETKIAAARSLPVLHAAMNDAIAAFVVDAKSAVDACEAFLKEKAE